MHTSSIDRSPFPSEREGNGSPENHQAEPGKKIQAVEVMVFLLLIVPPMVLSFFSDKQANVRFAEVAISSILNDFALLSLVFYFIWRNQESLAAVGWSFDHLRGDIALGLVLFVPVYLGANALASYLHETGLSAPTKEPSFLAGRGFPHVLMALLIVTVVAVVEETVFRGYLMRRFEAVTASRGAAVILSAFVFSLGHGYEGMAGVISVFALGVVFALIYLWRKSLVALITIHFLTDFTSIVLPTFLQT